jgi:hypothetical protein
LVSCIAPDAAEGIVFSPCAPLVVVPEEGTLPEELASVRAAFALWQAVGIDAFTLESLPDAPRLLLRFKDGPSPFHGVYEPSVGLVTVNRKMQDRPRDITVAHELGHALGLPHVDPAVRASVMNPDNHTEAPNPQDERELHLRWSCPSVP